MSTQTLQFDLGELIGEGGFGAVYKAVCRNDGTKCAIKRLAELDDEALRRFQREVRMQSQMDHPNVTRLLAMNLSDNPPWFAMPRAKENLTDRISRMGGGEQLLWCFYDLARGVEYLHQNKMIHRDLKPHNALVFESTGANERVCVADLGLGRFVQRDTTTLTMTNEGLGTAAYCAPEQWSDAKNVGMQADIYALGKILYHILTGRIPQVGAVDVTGVPRKFSYIIQRATRLAPADRYQSVQELINDLDIVTNATPGLAVASETARALLEQLISGGQFTEATVQPLARLLADNADDYSLQIGIVPKLTEPVLRLLIKSFPDQFRIIFHGYDTAISGTLAFGYCDTVARFYSSVFAMTKDDLVRANILKRLLSVGYGHNRWYVRETLGDILEHFVKGDASLIFIARDALRSNKDAALWSAEDWRKRSLPQILRVTLQELEQEEAAKS